MREVWNDTVKKNFEIFNDKNLFTDGNFVCSFVDAGDCSSFIANSRSRRVGGDAAGSHS